MNCIKCNKQFHTCPSCDISYHEHEYCTRQCWENDGSPKYTFCGRNISKIKRNYSELGKFVDAIQLDNDWNMHQIEVNDDESCFEIYLYYVNVENSCILSFHYDDTVEENVKDFSPNKGLIDAWRNSSVYNKFIESD
jgi:hypothetical protein